jgi:hypothetical protein
MFDVSKGNLQNHAPFNSTAHDHVAALTNDKDPKPTPISDRIKKNAEIDVRLFVT